MNLLLSGVVGSTAYGLAHEGSDVDMLGLYAADTTEVLSLHPPSESIVKTKPDITLHEARKYCQLALKCNPTVMELMWLEEHTTDSLLGSDLIDIRTAFLSAPYVRNAYLGYATQQFKKLKSRGDGTFGPDLARRTAKHARHMYRLLRQGAELWQTGHLTLRLVDPETVWAFGERVAGGDIAHAELILEDYEARFNLRPSVLPERPDITAVEQWLQRTRATFYAPVRNVPRETPESS